MDGNTISNPLVWRGIERIIIIVGAVFFGLLGYKLYINGITKSKSNVELKSAFVNFILSGSGPGLIFMVLGAFVLLSSIFYGGASFNTKEIIEERPSINRDQDVSIEEDITSKEFKVEAFEEKLSKIKAKISNLEIQIKNKATSNQKFDEKSLNEIEQRIMTKITQGDLKHIDPEYEEELRRLLYKALKIDELKEKIETLNKKIEHLERNKNPYQPFHSDENSATLRSRR